MVKISVIVPVYNVENCIARCLESILEQTYQNFEILCVNDCTPDNSMEIVDEFIEKYPGKVRRIDNEKNLGLGATRDHGIQEANGEFLVFFDSDDYIKINYLETYLEEMECTDADIVMGGYIRSVKRKETVVEMKNTPCTPWLYPSVWIRMYRKSFLDKHHLNFRGIRMYEDNPFNYRCMLAGAKISVIDYCGYYYTWNPNSITHERNGVEKYQKYLQNFREVYEEYHGRESFEKNREMLEYVYLSGILSSMLLHSRHSGKEKAYFMYTDYKEQMQEMFPDYRKNKSIGFWKLKEEQRKVRYATAIFMMAERFKMGKLLVWLISL